MTDAPRNAEKTGRRKIWLAVLVAVLGLGGITAGQLGPNRHRIENDLTDRSTHALAAAGQQQPGVAVSFSGRDAVVHADSISRRVGGALSAAELRQLTALTEKLRLQP